MSKIPQGEWNAIAARYQGGDRRDDKDLEQVHLVLGFPSVGYADPDYYAASLLSTIVGGGMSSRLFQEIREKRGLVYTIYAFGAAYEDGGLFGVYAGTGPSEIVELVPVVCDQLLGAIDKIDEGEIGRAKAQIKAGMLMSLESTMSRAEQLGQHMLLFGRPIPTQEIIAKIDEIDVGALRRAAGKLFNSKPTIAAMGALGALEPFDQTVRRFT